MNEASHVLEEIRRTELEAARNVDRARARADEIVNEARARAGEMVEEARKKGREASRRHVEETIADAEMMAADIRRRGVDEAAKLHQASAETLSSVIEEMVSVVLAPPSEPGV